MPVFFRKCRARLHCFHLPDAGVATALLERAVSKNVGFSFFASLGGVFDIGFADMIDFLGVDPETKAIILYIEG